MKIEMCSHLNALILHFEKYFSEDMEKYNWIRNPFLDNANAPLGFTSLEAEQSIDLISYTTLIHSFHFGLRLELNFKA